MVHKGIIYKNTKIIDTRGAQLIKISDHKSE